MVSVEAAVEIIRTASCTIPVETIDLDQAVGRVLAESVLADRDIPPFNRVTMDGIAIASDSFTSKDKSFKILGLQTAGSEQQTLSEVQSCMEVMTGAVLPKGSDAVIRYEDLELGEGYARIVLDRVNRGMNIHPKGSDAQKGDTLLKPGQLISPAEVALLSSVGKSRVTVMSFPRTALVSTGDELVEVDHEPAPHQIRRSNTQALKAAMKEIHWNASSFHLPDNKAIINERLREILNNHDVIIISGGVSKGKLDFVPVAMENLGVKKKFHEVSQRPGKPFWFGTHDDGKVVFALPGNPVSTYVCFYRYIRPWIFQQMHVKPKPMFAGLSEDFSFTPDLTYFLQVRTEVESGVVVAYPRPGGGSGDFANLTGVDGFLELPREKSEFKAGEVYPYFSFRH